MSLAVIPYSHNKQNSSDTIFGICSFLASQTFHVIYQPSVAIASGCSYVACKISTVAKRCFEYLHKGVIGVYEYVFGGKPKAFNPSKIANRLIYVQHSKESHKLLDVLKPESSLSILVARLFLECIYKKKYGQITTTNTRSVILVIHPDKNRYPQATEIFQLHQKLLDISDLSDSKGSIGAQMWVVYKLFGWLGRYLIKSTMSKDVSSTPQ